MNAVLFPGQGAQYVGMGKSLYEHFSEARDVFTHIDTIVGFPLSQKCFEGPAGDLKDTSIQQLAIVATSLAAFEVLKRKNITISYFAGLSLGEYSCLYPAGVLALGKVVALVRERAQAMQEAASKNPSGMFVVIGLSEEALREKQDLGFHIANVNAAVQIAISVAQEKKEHVREALLDAGARVMELEVSGGFHSPFMALARHRLEKSISGMEFSDATIPIVSNVTAKAHSDGEEIKNNLIHQLTSTVLWKQSVDFMAQSGTDAFFEVGPGRVLKGLLRKINPQLRGITIEKKEDLDHIEKINSGV